MQARTLIRLLAAATMLVVATFSAPPRLSADICTPESCNRQCPSGGICTVTRCFCLH